MNVKQILSEWLTAHGYDGLAGDECGCRIDDLVPCDGNPLDCTPAYACPIKPCKAPDSYSWDCMVSRATLDSGKCIMDEEEPEDEQSD